MEFEKIQHILKFIGLTDAEAKVFLALLKQGTTTTGPIIKISGLHKATVYSALQRLMEKGLVGYVVKGKKRYFEALDPKQLIHILKEKEEHLKEIIPILTRMKKSNAKQEVIVYYGKNGVKSILEKMLEELKPNGKYYDFGVSGLFRKVLPYFWDRWQRLKKKYGIKSYCIFTEKLRNTKLVKDYYGEAKFVPKQYFSISDTMIYKDVVLLLIWMPESPIAIRIKNKENAESYLRQFKLMWKFAKK